MQDIFWGASNNSVTDEEVLLKLLDYSLVRTR
jgi:hypothetical protein